MLTTPSYDAKPCGSCCKHGAQFVCWHHRIHCVSSCCTHKFKTLAFAAAPPWRQAGPPRAQVRVPERLLRTLVDFSGTGCSFNCAGCMSHNTVARTRPCWHAAAPRVAVRKEIRKMSAAEQARFCDAVQTMMTNTRGPRSSEFYRLASE